MAGNNCPDMVAVAFDNAGLDVEDDNFNTLMNMKLRRFAPILPAVLNCEVCSESGGSECAESVALDVVEVALTRSIGSENELTEYLSRMQESVETEQLTAGE